MKTLKEEDYIDDWKEQLILQFIIWFMGTSKEKESANKQIGMFYLYSAPASLYKYFNDNLERLDTLRQNQMWYSAPCNFNDVFDCEMSVNERDTLNSALKLVPKNVPVRPGSQMWNKIKASTRQGLREFKKKFDEMRKTIGISCFSETNDSLLMWAHYANNHRGICAEYDLMQINRELGFTPVPVIYSDNLTCFQSSDFEKIEEDAVRVLISSITTKSREWSYEREWRIIREKEACAECWDETRRGALLDMVVPKSLTLGCAATKEFEKEVKVYCKSNKINLYKMEKDLNQYKLNRKIILKY